MADEFSFDDDPKGGSDTELSLDDFFEPASKGAEEPKPQTKGPSIDDFFSPPAGDSDNELPMEKGKSPDKVKGAKPKAAPAPAPAPMDELPADEVKDVGAPTPLEADEESEEAPAGEAGPGFLKQNLIFIVIGLLVVMVLSAGGFLGYTFLFKPKDEVAQVKPATPDKPPVKPATPDKPKPPANKPPAAKPSPDKPPVAKPETPAKPAGDKDFPAIDTDKPEPVKPANNKSPLPPAKEPPKPVKPAKPEPPAKPAAKPAPKPKPSVAVSSGPYWVQVGSYMMDPSKAEPEAKLRDAGYSSFNYVPEYRSIKIYTVYVGRGLSRDEAGEIARKLENMGYHPEIVNDGSGFKVMVYRYGSSSVANTVKKKLSKAGMKNVTVQSERIDAKLDQLRVGGFSTRSEAEKAKKDLVRAGFREAEIIKE